MKTADPLRRPWLTCAIMAVLASSGLAQPPAEPDPKKAAEKPALPAAISRGAEVVLSLEEKTQPGSWPYEGVYKVGGEIPIGYKVGGTGISAMTLIASPGFDANDGAKAAVQRALAFTLQGLDHPLMSPTDYDAGYDVRGWGYTYALTFMLKLKDRALIPDADKEPVEKSVRWCIDALQKTEIPKVGGWNYARPPGKDKVAPPSPFMTAPSLQALFEAKRAGYEVDPAVITRALDYLESARTPDGAINYSGDAKRGRQDPVPGAVGRMLAAESVLYLAGRSSQSSVRGAIDAFIVHWQWLEKRRAQPRTHEPPYTIAPYYFYYAHYYAAFAVELLPQNERAEYRRRLSDLLFQTRHEDGSWNDRVFPRSANFGTSMAALSMLMPTAAKPAGWPKPDTK